MREATHSAPGKSASVMKPWEPVGAVAKCQVCPWGEPQPWSFQLCRTATAALGLCSKERLQISQWSSGLPDNHHH